MYRRIYRYVCMYACTMLNSHDSSTACVRPSTANLSIYDRDIYIFICIKCVYLRLYVYIYMYVHEYFNIYEYIKV